MLPSRFMGAQSSAIRKSRLEAIGRPSYLPKPRNAGSIDRLSQDRLSHRPSAARSSSAEPPRATLTGRPSREASATKIPMNRRSKSQQGESRYGQAPITPLRSSHYSRPTTTPVRTPSEDRSTRSWQASLDRALAFVTVKDQRPLSNPAWQRSECHRAQELLASRGIGDGGGGGNMALIRPLTITRFVDITGALLNTITKDTKLNNDNYVTKVPHIAKLLLYPGVVSKSWLKTVNTLHAFPHALALICYLLDLAQRIEMPVEDEWLYLEKDELAVLRRDFLQKCWIRFQEPDPRFDELDEEYLHNLRQLLGNDEEKISELRQAIKKYELCLEDEAEIAAKAEESRRIERHAALLAALRGAKGGRVHTRAQLDAAREKGRDKTEELKGFDAEIERANAESQQLRVELEQQTMSVQERTRLIDEMDYANRVQGSKRALAEQVTKLLNSKEMELTTWQHRTLDSCLLYKQSLIHLVARLPQLAELAIDEKELMDTQCAETVTRALDALRLQVCALTEQLAAKERARHAAKRQRSHKLDEISAQIAETKAQIEREQQLLSAEQQAENSSASAWSAEEEAAARRMEELRGRKGDAGESERRLWEGQAQAWKEKLSILQKYVEGKREEAKKTLAEAKRKRVELVCRHLRQWSEAVDRAE